MFFLNDIKDYKSVTTGLKRELRALGISTVSHNQVLEALAKSMGHANWAALQAGQAAQVKKLAAPEEKLPKREDTYYGESRDRKDREQHAAWRLFNKKGELDLVVSGPEAPSTVLVHGLTLEPATGTLEDIFSSSAAVASANRNDDDNLTVHYEGDTEVNWDGQETRKDSRGVTLWLNDSGDVYPQDDCVLAPEGFDSETNLLNQEEVEEHELRNREALVDAAFRFIVDNEGARNALGEMPLDEDGAFEHEFFVSALSFSGPKASLIGRAQYAAGFAMHLGEFVLLRQRLATSVQPALF